YRTYRHRKDRRGTRRSDREAAGRGHRRARQPSDRRHGPGRRLHPRRAALSEKTMRAIVLTAHGGPETVEYVTDYPDPAPGPGEVLIRIGACSLNYHDVFTRRGMPGIKVPLPVVPGLD